MDLLVRKRLPHTVPQWVSEDSWFFITINCEPRGKNQLCQESGACGVTYPIDGRDGGAQRIARPTVDGFGRARRSARAAIHPTKTGVQGIARPTDDPTVGDAVLIAMKFNHEQSVWHCRLCLLMPDHLHAILAFPREPGMATTIKNWKRYVAGKCGVNWQRDFFDHRLRDHHELDEKTSYILMNPVRKGLCEHMEDWRWVYRPDELPR